MPSFIFFDNNCRLKQHLDSTNDHYFDHVGLPVDVFHAKTKHKETDEFCQRYCNPAAFPQLIGDNKKWVFNSSAAEQTNRWFGGFRSIVREMSPARYNFYLDEMIMLRNQFTVQNLERKGHFPHMIPEDVLRES
ncbi:hypothetical protein BD410DRAFT_734945 [Rickenella mellea]|uniref:Uncharacterized protein n=1 Tax=Rickenella mellea TaxID=50990 RepID=A0A4Y7PFC0_9AGAM|nr:hypothetical protein BD410DRAFT_734945 [Rickenella mellea]